MTQPDDMLTLRQRQAFEEVGTTLVGRVTAATVTAVFLATIASATLLGARRGLEAWTPFGALVSEVVSAWRGAGELGVLRANRLVLRAFHDFEEALEETSTWRAALLEPVQGVLTRWGGVGNEDALVGLDGYLFFRPDVEAVAGPALLEPRRLAARALGGEVWEPRPSPDPLPALRELHDQLGRRGVGLVVLPVPTKASLDGHRLSARRASQDEPLHNPSWSAWLATVAAAGIEVFDPTGVLAAARSPEGDVYLARDTHWLPHAMESVAADLAARLDPDLPPPPDDFYLTRRTAVLDGRGDIARMLGAGASSLHGAPQTVTVQPVLKPNGSLYRPLGEAPIVLLGDSFANVFSDEALGWGSGAGLAEQLAYHLQRPVRRVARNAGGAWQSRHALAGDPSGLRGARVVVYEFSARELAFGDWRRVSLPAPVLSTQ